MNAVEVENLSFSYNGEKALEDVSFTLEKGMFMAVMGPNGCGKSTLTKILVGILKGSTGNIRVFGKDPRENPTEVQRMVGYMPQREHISHNMPMTVRDVVLMGRLARKGLVTTVSRKDIKAAKRALEIVGISNLWKKRFTELSGGQQQKAMLARALAVESDMLILDEPFAAMDTRSQQEILEVISSMRDEGKTIIMVLHDVNLALHHLDRVLLLNKKAIAFGEPKLALNRENLVEAYGAVIRIIVCEEGYCHPLVGDSHA